MPDQVDGSKDDEESSAKGNGATWYLLRCRTLRESGALRIKELADEAKVDRSTIEKIEKRFPVTKPTAFRVFKALQKHHAVELDPEKEITNSLRKRP